MLQRLNKNSRRLISVPRGFSMIELLVAVLVMAVGVLGIAGLQMVSLQQNRSALFRAQASQAAQDMMDRIRANPTSTYTGVTFDSAPPAATNCYTNSCTVAQMAVFDIASWKCSLESVDADGATYTVCGTLGISGSIPSGKGSITLASSVYQVQVQWVDDRAGTLKTISIRSQL